MDRPPTEILQRFLRSQLSREETRGLVLDMLRRTREPEPASGRSREAPIVTITPATNAAYDRAFDLLHRFAETYSARLVGEKVTAEGQWEVLKEHPPGRRRMMVTNQKAFQTWGLFDRLLRESREIAGRDPQASLEAADLALAIVERLDASIYGAKFLVDFQGAAVGARGNALRLLNQLEAAQNSLADAAELLEEGTGEPMEKAELLSLQARLLRDFGAFEEAATLLERPLTIYRRLKDPHLEGQTLVHQGEILGHLDPGQGIALLQQGIQLLDEGRDLQLELRARHHLIWFLNDAGRPWHASAMLEVSRPLYRKSADADTRLELRWLEGRIAQASGLLPDAEHMYLEVWLRLTQRERLLDFTLLTLDLADVYVAQGNVRSARLLVREFYRFLSSRGMHREGLVTWIVVRKALAHKTANPAIFQQAALYYRRAWKRPLRSPRTRKEEARQASPRELREP